MDTGDQDNRPLYRRTRLFLRPAILACGFFTCLPIQSAAMARPGSGILSTVGGNHAFFMIAYGIPIAAGLILLLVLLWNILLRRSVMTRTAQLRVELAERKKAEASLEENRRRHSALMANLQGVIYRVSFKPEPSIEYITDGSLEQSGYSAEDFLSGRVTWQELIIDEDRQLYQTAIDQALKTGENYQLEYRIIRRDGELRWMLDKGRGVYDSQNKLVGLEGFVLDISQRKEAEAKLRTHEARLASIFKSSPVGIGLVLNRVFLTVNDRVCEMTGYCQEELIGQSARILYPSQEEYEHVGREKYGQIHKQGTGAVETQWRCKDGRIIDVLLSSTPIDVNDLSKGVTFSAQDITDIKFARQTAIAERDKAQQYLDVAAVMMLVLDNEGHIKLINKKGCEILECSEAQVRGKDWFSNFLPEGQRKQSRRIFCDLITDRDTADDIEYAESAVRTLTGREKLIAWHNTIIRDEEGIVIGTLSSGLDITEQRMAEEALSESEQRFRNVIESSPMGIHMYELMDDGRLIFTGSNQAARTILGFDDRMEYGKPIEQVFPDLAGTAVPDTYCNICREGGTYHGDNFEYHDTLVNAYFEFDAFQTSPGKMAVMFMDVTERIQTQHRLEMTQFALDHAGEACFWMESDAKFIYVNEAACRSLEYTREELLTMGVQDIDPDFPADIWPQHWQEVKEKKTMRFESHHKTKDGIVFPVDITVTFIEYGDREYMWAFVRDSTSRKRAENAIREREEFLSSIIENIPNMIFLKDAKDLAFVRFNKAGEELLGFSRDELIGKKDSDIFPDAQARAFLESDKEAIRKRKLFDIPEEPIQTKHGERILHTKKIPIFNDNSEPVYLLGISEDITDRIQSEKALRDAEQRKELALQGGDLGTWDWNVVTGEVVFNERWASMLGYTLDEIEPNVSTWEHMMHPDDKQFVMDVLNDHLEGKTEFYETEHRLRHKAGHWEWVLDRGQVIERDADGKPLRACGTHLNVSDRKRAEEAIQESEMKLHAIFDHHFQLTGLLDRQGRLLSANKTVLEFAGVNESEIIGKYLWEGPWWAPSQRPEIKELVKRAGQGEFIRIETTHIAKDGSIRDFDFSLSPVTNADGKVVFIVPEGRDITEIKQAEENHLFTQFATDHAAESIFWVGSDAKFFYVNEKACQMLGYSREELLTMNVWEIDPLMPREAWGAHWEEMRCKRFKYFEMEHKTKKGRIFPVEITSNFIEYGDKEYICAFAHDITERKAAEKAREKLLNELRSKNEELEGIVFIASHDLRSPLVNIRGFTGELEKSLGRLEKLLDEEPLSESTRNELKRLFGEDIPESLSFIKSGNSKMDVLLNGLLRLSRVGSAEINAARIEVNPCLEGIINSFLFRTRQGDIEITVDPQLPVCMADETLLNQVFSNLIDNAIKYRSHERPPQIHISGQTRDKTVEYCIRDNGIGIAPEHIEKVFEIFHRLNPDSDEAGEGLGLTIVRRVLKRLEGDIRIESKPNEGTWVYVELPKA